MERFWRWFRSGVRPLLEGLGECHGTIDTFGWVSESFSKRFDDSTLDASLAFGFATMGSYGVSDHKNSFQTKVQFQM
eukprot:351423-Amorphochlora_amoeboformis.AAC.2